MAFWFDAEPTWEQDICASLQPINSVQYLCLSLYTDKLVCSILPLPSHPLSSNLAIGGKSKEKFRSQMPSKCCLK